MNCMETLPLRSKIRRSDRGCCPQGCCRASPAKPGAVSGAIHPLRPRRFSRTGGWSWGSSTILGLGPLSSLSSQTFQPCEDFFVKGIRHVRQDPPDHLCKLKAMRASLGVCQHGRAHLLM
ncbi:hypothetical protein N657DRAFT_90932 [Parathielavia appendiculata]|uniref:Uncharacterized protein n=1 Tax=Parathielavia appendiculata TaxID=2587402 RepID=A0AAN6UAY3_9PEZI|nr:hypothetical protein N657DRAFT_90932 [Parathielavia appendiculata]